MIQLIAGLIILIVIIGVVYWVLQRHYDWNLTRWLRIRLLKALHLYDTPVGSFTDYVMQKAKDWENTKFYFIMGPIFAGYGIILIFFFMPEWLFYVTIGGAFTIVVVVLLSAFIYIKYYAHYTKYEAREVHVQESLTKGFRDHWPIASSVELNPDDPRIDRAHQLVKMIMERRRQEREHADNNNNADTEPATPGNPSNPSTAIQEADPTAIAAEIIPVKGADFLPCRVCGNRPEHEGTVFCADCGAKRFPDERYYLETRGFCSETDPWHQYLLITDCALEQHRKPISQDFYAGKIPVRKPVSKMGYIRVGQILNTTEEDEGGAVDILQVTNMIPVVMITESVEYVRRVTRQERGHPFSEEGFGTAGYTYDGYTSVKATELLGIAQQTIQTLKQTKQHGKDEATATAMEIIGTYLESRQPPEDKPSLRAKAWQIGKWLLLIAAIAISIFLFVVVVLPWFHTLTTPPLTNSTLPELFFEVMRCSG